MTAAFDRNALLDAFDRIGRAAVEAGTKLQIAVYGGSALMLASNFRGTTEDVDVSELPRPLPDWLATTVRELAAQNRWHDDWFNDAVTFHLSSLADQSADHLEFGTFPRDASIPGLVVSVPTAEYLLALKLKAFRVMDPSRGETERLDILNACGRHNRHRECDPLAWPILPGKRCFFREAALSAEEHEP